MEKKDLEKALTETRKILHDAITTSSYRGEAKKNGQEAKNAAIRSSAPIQQLHSVVGKSLYEDLISRNLKVEMWPPLGQKSPELKVTGLLKAKDQDISFTVDQHKPETIDSGVEAGRIDPIGFHATNRALVVGVRSQLSSLAKNFDTLVERAFAETLNLRLRCPKITIAEVYLIPLHEFDDESLKKNKMGFKKSKVDLGKFVRIFNAITDANYHADVADIYKYNATMLIVADFSQEKVRVLWSKDDVEAEFGAELAEQMSDILPENFSKRISDSYIQSLSR